jgi:hypothetical protein
MFKEIEETPEHSAIEAAAEYIGIAPERMQAAIEMYHRQHQTESARQQPAALGGKRFDSTVLEVRHDYPNVNGGVVIVHEDHYSELLRAANRVTPSSAPVVKGLLEALELYANADYDGVGFWDGIAGPGILSDRGKIARKALSQHSLQQPAPQQATPAITLEEVIQIKEALDYCKQKTEFTSVRFVCNETMKQLETLESRIKQQPAPGLSAAERARAHKLMVSAMGGNRAISIQKAADALAELEKLYTLSKKQTGGEG